MRYQVRLVGGEAKLGHVEAADVARLVLGVERAVARAAGAAVGRPVKRSGRRGKLLEEASNFRLVGVHEGSVVLDMELPSTSRSDELDLDIASLGDLGWELAISAIVGDTQADLGVVRSLADLADQLNIGVKYEAIEFKRVSDKAPARLDGRQRRRLREVADEQEHFLMDAGVAGTLVEANFERFTAQVRTPEAQLVEVVFEDDQSDEVQDALRQQSSFEGEVEVDPITRGVKSIRLRQMTRVEQMILGAEEAGAFWRSPSFSELQATQDTRPVTSFEGLRDGSLTDAEFDEFLSVLDC